MNARLLLPLVLIVAGGGAVSAGESARQVPALSLGGAASQPSDGMRLAAWDTGSLVAGITSPPTAVSYPGKGMQMGGFLAWRAQDYRIDVMVAPSLEGNVSAGLGATTGAEPGQVGTSYGVRFGAAWSVDRFTLNPASNLSTAQVVEQSNDVNMTFTVNHALTPRLSVIGTAEARHGVGIQPDGGMGQNRFLVGAGLGYRF